MGHTACKTKMKYAYHILVGKPERETICVKEKNEVLVRETKCEKLT